MKRTLLMLMILAAHAGQASHMNTNLYLETSRDEWITVAIDHRYYPNPIRRFELRDITPGPHFIEVFGFGSHPHGPFGAGHPLFGGTVHFPASSLIYARINKHHQFKIKNVVPKFIAPPVCAPVPPPPMIHPMSEHHFNSLLHSIGSKSFESTRLLVARQGIGSNHLTAGQVLRLMDLMTFESTKLELAKFAYGRVLDKDRFYLVNDGFTFESSIRELDRYILKNG